MRISPHFSYDELTRSDTGLRLGIVNTPNGAQLRALTALCNNILEPISDGLKRRVWVSSGFRCPELNTAIGGSETSQHMKGEAADIEIEGLSTDEAFKAIVALNLPFDQIISEFGRWVHISYHEPGRREQLYAIKDENKKTVYRKVQP